MKNQVTLIGYVGAEPETRAYPSGDLVTSISLATSEKWRDRQSKERSFLFKGLSARAHGRKMALSID